MSENRPAGSDHRTRFLRVDHLHSDLAARSVRGGGVTLAAQGFKMIAQAAAIVVLARLLAPADFGLFAMVAAFLTLLELFKDMGLSTATVQRADITPRQVDTLFWLNCALGLGVAAIFAALGPVLAWVYGEPQLTEITAVVAVAFVLTGAAAQHLALLRRQMRFARVAAILVGAEFAALAAAVAAAAAGLGIWALVIQRLVWALAIAVGAWSQCGWRPGRPGPIGEVRSFISFGGNSTASMSLNYLASSLDKILIGWYWGAIPLGFYERAQKLQLLPIQNIVTPIGNVALALLSRLADNPAQYRDAYRKTVERMAMVLTPLGGLMVAGAEPLVALVLGPQWLPMAPVLAAIGAAMAFAVHSYPLSWLYLSQDRTGEMLRASLVNSALVVPGVLIGLPFGPVGVALAYVIVGTFIRLPIVFWLAGRRGPVRTRDLWRITAIPTAAGTIVAAAIAALRLGTGIDAISPIAEVLLLCLVALATSVLVYAVFPNGRRALRSILQLPRLMSGRNVEAAA